MSLLAAKNVTKRYGNLAALRDVSFELGEGELLALIGPNGAGKTTFVNVLSGSAPGWTGDIEFDGRSMRGLKPHAIARRGIARTFQVAQPFRDMTTGENVMVASLFGSAGHVGGLREARTRAHDVLEFVGLSAKVDEPAETLNAPERKRLEVARALALEPRLLLLDEVMAGLNATEVDAAVELVRAIRERGVSIIMIEHVMRAVVSLADRVVVLHHGEKIVEGEPATVLADEQVVGAYLGTRRVPAVAG